MFSVNPLHHGDSLENFIVLRQFWKYASTEVLWKNVCNLDTQLTDVACWHTKFKKAIFKEVYHVHGSCYFKG